MIFYCLCFKLILVGVFARALFIGCFRIWAGCTISMWVCRTGLVVVLLIAGLLVCVRVGLVVNLICLFWRCFIGFVKVIARRLGTNHLGEA
jgi:hypothetical protein